MTASLKLHLFRIFHRATTARQTRRCTADRAASLSTRASSMLLGSLLALAAPSLQEAEVARGSLTQLSDGDLKFELFLPQWWQHPAASGSRWPVLVFLHGRGESGGFDVTNAQSLPWQLVAGNNASFVTSLGFIVLVPQCPQAWPDANQQLSPKPNPTRTSKPYPYL